MKKLNHRRIAEGEVTGHYHELSSGEVWEKDNGELEVKLIETSTLTHQEHKTIKLPPQEYDRFIVQEFDPFEEEIRKVVD